MPGVRALRKIQMGVEASTASGTAVAATAIWRGLGTIEDGLSAVQPDENVGYLSPVERVYIPTTEARLSMDSIEATFEQLPYILNAGVALATPAQDASGGYVYTYPFATTAQATPATYTIEGGDNQQAERFAYGFVTDFELAGAPREAWKVSANWQGRQVGTTTFTTPISLPTVEEILFGKSTIAIDAVNGTLGATVKSSTLLGASLKVTSGFVPVFTANGEIYFDFVKQVAPEIMLDVTFEHDASAVAEIAAWRAKTPRMIRIQSLGSPIAGGSAYTAKTLRIDCAGHWETFSKIDEIDGNDVVTGTFRCTLNTTPTPDLFCNIYVVNTLSALP
jgi:hypothetical protein